MWLVVGLGNPGKKYEFTRHNVGFLAVQHFAKSLNAPPVKKSEHKAFTSRFRMSEHEILLALPQTFMNLSGDSVQSLAAYYKIGTDKIVVLHDEIDLPYGVLKLQKARGHGGHNGIRDIHKKLGSNEYHRLRIGVGRPNRGSEEVGDFVLNNFSKSEMSELSEFLDRCGDGLELLFDNGFDRAATSINQSANKPVN